MLLLLSQIFLFSCRSALTHVNVHVVSVRLSLCQLWDIRKKGAIHTFQNTYQVLAVTFNDTSDQILSGGIDNDIKVLTSLQHTQKNFRENF